MRTYIKSSEFRSRPELLIIENCLPLIDEVTVDLVLKCLQHLHLLALHLEVLGGACDVRFAGFESVSRKPKEFGQPAI